MDKITGLANKFAEIDGMRKMGLTVPTSIMLGAQETDELRRLVKEHKEIEHWYIRTEPEVNLSVEERVQPRERVFSAVIDLFQKYPGSGCILTALVPPRRSGVLLKRRDFTYVECVQGGLETLLRLGVTPGRYLLLATGDVVAHTEHLQEFRIEWHGGRARRLDDSTRCVLPPEVVGSLRNASSVSESTRIYEWLEDSNGQLLFIDTKKLPEIFMNEQEAVLHGLEREEIWTIQRPLRGRISNASKDGGGVVRVSRPLFKYVASVLPRAEGLLMRGGGALSHLAVYAALRNCNAVISQSLYRKTHVGQDVWISPGNWTESEVR